MRVRVAARNLAASRPGGGGQTLAHPMHEQAGMRPALILVAVSLTTLGALPRPAAACSLAWNEDLTLDPAYADDTTPPGEVVVGDVTVHRSDDLGCAGTSCGDNASLSVPVAADDDRAPADRLGFELRLVGGALPRELTLPAGPVLPGGGAGNLILFFDPDVDELDFVLEVRAVDLNGNRGAPAIVRVVERVPGGCAASRGGAGGLGLVLVGLAAALATRRRRRREG